MISTLNRPNHQLANAKSENITDVFVDSFFVGLEIIF